MPVIGNEKTEYNKISMGRIKLNEIKLRKKKLNSNTKINEEKNNFKIALSSLENEINTAINF